MCNLQEVESEEHYLIRCELYPDIRQTLFHRAFLINPDFLGVNRYAPLPAIDGDMGWSSCDTRRKVASLDIGID